MYCTGCGKEIPDDSRFCPNCGKSSVQGKSNANGRTSELIRKAKGEDQSAISILYEQTYNQVYYTVKSMIKDEDAVFDILQDSYIKAFSHLGRFESYSGNEFVSCPYCVFLYCILVHYVYSLLVQFKSAIIFEHLL